MTNETTASQPMQELVRDLYNFEGGRHFALRLEKMLASQPESIGDDEQFQAMTAFMLRAFPDKSHAEITAEIDRALGAAPMVADPAGVVGCPSDGWPDEIYLNAGEGPLSNFSEYAEVDWCDHPQGENDVRYIRAELCDIGVVLLSTINRNLGKRLSAALAATVKAVPSEALEIAVKACERVQERVVESNGGPANNDDWSTLDEGIYAGAGYCLGELLRTDFAAPLADKTGGGE